MVSEQAEAERQEAHSGDTPTAGEADVSAGFDPTRLLTLLTEVAEAYAERAREPEVVEKTSGKEAIAIVKSCVEVIADLTAPHPPHRVGGADQRRRGYVALDHGRLARETSNLKPETPLQGDGSSPLEEAVAEVCQYDPETAHLEPWARLIIRMDSLTKKLECALLKPQTPNPKPSDKPDDQTNPNSPRGP